jgi:uncharacterized membrane protein HdeD (DUF308 family)
MPHTLAQNWWALALRGLVAILFGLACFVWPFPTLLILVLLYGAYALADGILAVAAALSRRSRSHWWALLLEGLCGIAVGVITFIWTGITELALLYLSAFWAIVTGVLEIVAALRLRISVPGEWALALSGLVSILFGFVLLVWPGASAVALIWVIGAYAIVFGILLLALAFRLRAWGRGASPFTGSSIPLGG